MAAASLSTRDCIQDYCQHVRIQCCSVKSQCCMQQGGYNSGDYIPAWMGALSNSSGAVESSTEGSSSYIRFLALCLRFLPRSLSRRLSSASSARFCAFFFVRLLSLPAHPRAHLSLPALKPFDVPQKPSVPSCWDQVVGIMRRKEASQVLRFVGRWRLITLTVRLRVVACALS